MRKTNYTYGHYAYTHAAPDGSVFYVGKGSGRRAYALLCRHPDHQKRIDEIGRENVIITIYPEKTHIKACNIESTMIAEHAAAGSPLCNIVGVVPLGRKVYVGLDEDHSDLLRALAADTKMSITEHMRCAVDAYLQAPMPAWSA